MGFPPWGFWLPALGLLVVAVIVFLVVRRHLRRGDTSNLTPQQKGQLLLARVTIMAINCPQDLSNLGTDPVRGAWVPESMLHTFVYGDISYTVFDRSATGCSDELTPATPLLLMYEETTGSDSMTPWSVAAFGVDGDPTLDKVEGPLPPTYATIDWRGSFPAPAGA